MKEEFQKLVDEHYQALYRFAFSLARNPERASDLVQQTFCIWAQKNHQLKDRSKAKTWLFTTLYREQLNYSRRNTKFPQQDIDDLEYQISADTQEAGRSLDAQRAIRLLQSLEENYRAPLSLFFLEQHSYKEIAEILDIPIGTVMSRIARGKKQLRASMEKMQSAASKVVNFKNAKANN